MDSNPKKQYGDLKPDPTRVPAVAVLMESVAYEEGAGKYGPFNWRVDAVSVSTYLAAMRRHIDAYIDGEDYDPKYPRKHHLAAVRACCGIILDAEACGMLIDDRPPKGLAAQLIDDMTRREDEGREE